MPSNCVTPSHLRYQDKDGKSHSYNPVRYRVDGDFVPEVVGRGVLDMKFLEMRDDYAERFSDCERPADVNAVLKAEGYWG